MFFNHAFLNRVGHLLLACSYFTLFFFAKLGRRQGGSGVDWVRAGTSTMFGRCVESPGSVKERVAKGYRGVGGEKYSEEVFEAG